MSARLFVGIPLPEQILDPLISFRQQHATPKGLKWTKPSNLHITACFLGETEEEEIPSIEINIRKVTNDVEPFSVLFQSFRYVPKRRPRMIWAAFEKNSDFENLVRGLHTILQVDQDHKEPIPHVTMARLKQRTDMELKPVPVPVLFVNKMVLWKSILSPDGPTYHALHQFEFTG